MNRFIDQSTIELYARRYFPEGTAEEIIYGFVAGFAIGSSLRDQDIEEFKINMRNYEKQETKG